MKVMYSFRTEKRPLPEPKEIFENVRRWHREFSKNPHDFFVKHEEWIKPMCQLRNGLFFSEGWDSKPLPFKNQYIEDSELKLEMEFIAKNFIRVYFETNIGPPYRVDTGLYTRSKPSLTTFFRDTNRIRIGTNKNPNICH